MCQRKYEHKSAWMYAYYITFSHFIPALALFAYRMLFIYTTDVYALSFYLHYLT